MLIYFLNNKQARNLVYISFQQIYETFKADRYFGYYERMQPGIFINDPELIKLVMVKHFDHFANIRSFNVDSGNKWMGEMLFMIHGAE